MVATMDAVKHIVSKDYEKIVFVCPPLEMKETKNTYTHEQRELGFRAAMGMYPDVEMNVIGRGNFLQDVQSVRMV